MSWKEQINSVISKLNSCLGITRRAWSFLNIASLLTIYHSLMQSRANYCCTTWAAWEPRGNKTIVQRLQAVCNTFFRLIFNLNHTDSARQLLKSYNIFQNYDFQVCQIMHKAVHDKLPLPLGQSLSTGNTFLYFTPSRIKKTQKKYFLCRVKNLEYFTIEF